MIVIYISFSSLYLYIYIFLSYFFILFYSLISTGGYRGKRTLPALRRKLKLLKKEGIHFCIPVDEEDTDDNNKEKEEKHQETENNNNNNNNNTSKSPRHTNEERIIVDPDTLKPIGLLFIF